MLQDQRKAAEKKAEEKARKEEAKAQKRRAPGGAAALRSPSQTAPSSYQGAEDR